MNELATSLTYPNEEMTSVIAGMEAKYNGYLVSAAGIVAEAVSTYKESGIRAAGGLYDEAMIAFKGALAYRPPTGNWEIDGSDTDNGDPVLRLAYAHCAAKVLESGNVRPYSSPRSWGYDRKRNLAVVAKTTFEDTWREITEGPFSTEEKAICGIVASDGLAIVLAIPEANEVIGYIGDSIDPATDTDSWVLDELVKSDHWLQETHRLAGPALVELTSDLDLLPLAA